MHPGVVEQVEVVQPAEMAAAVDVQLQARALPVIPRQRDLVVEKIGAPVRMLVLREGRELELSIVPAELDG